MLFQAENNTKVFRKVVLVEKKKLKLNTCNNTTVDAP